MVSKPTGGLQLKMMGAIDSLDPMGPLYTPLCSTLPNQYLQAILSIPQILMNYESDKRIHFLASVPAPDTEE